MAAFDKVKSGIPSADQLLDHIRMGDNVVWSALLSQVRAAVRKELGVAGVGNHLFLDFVGHVQKIGNHRGFLFLQRPDYNFPFCHRAILAILLQRKRETLFRCNVHDL